MTTQNGIESPTKEEEESWNADGMERCAKVDDESPNVTLVKVTILLDYLLSTPRGSD